MPEMLKMKIRKTNRTAVHMSYGIVKAGFILLGIASLACGPNERIMNSTSSETPVPANAAPSVGSLESDLQAMRNADFKFILVFRRKDGAVLTGEDKALAGSSTSFNANRRRISDDGKAIIIGSNFPFLPGTLEKMTEKFAMEDYSKPDSGPMVANSTANNTNSAPVR